MVIHIYTATISYVHFKPLFMKIYQQIKKEIRRSLKLSLPSFHLIIRMIRYIIVIAVFFTFYLWIDFHKYCLKMIVRVHCTTHTDCNLKYISYNRHIINGIEILDVSVANNLGCWCTHISLGALWLLKIFSWPFEPARYLVLALRPAKFCRLSN